MNLSYIVRNYLAVLVQRATIPPKADSTIPSPPSALTIRIRSPCKARKLLQLCIKDLKTSAVPQKDLQPVSALFDTWWDPAPSCTPLRCCKGCRSVESQTHSDLCAKRIGLMIGWPDYYIQNGRTTKKPAL